jgi:hypothetical protein
MDPQKSISHFRTGNSRKDLYAAIQRHRIVPCGTTYFALQGEVVDTGTYRSKVFVRICCTNSSMGIVAR